MSTLGVMQELVDCLQTERQRHHRAGFGECALCESPLASLSLKESRRDPSASLCTPIGLTTPSNGGFVSPIPL